MYCCFLDSMCTREKRRPVVRDADVRGCGRPRQHRLLYVLCTSSHMSVPSPDNSFEDEMKALNQLGWMAMCGKLFHVMIAAVMLTFEL